MTTTKTSKNDFKNANNCEKSQFYMIVFYKPEWASKVGLKAGQFSKLYHGFNTKPDGGLQNLKKLAEKYKTRYQTAVIYNSNKEEIQKYQGV